MTAIHGSKAKVTFSGQDITLYLDKAGVSQKADTAETTTFTKTSKNYVPGLKDGSAAIEGPFDATVHAILAPLFGGAAAAYVYYPNGSVTGQPRATVQAILADYAVESDVNAIGKLTGTLQFTGDVVWDTAP